MSSSNSYCIEILDNISIYIHRYLLPFLYILGNIGNLLSVIIFFKKSWRKNVCVFYFNICLLINSVYVNSTMLSTIFIVGFGINLQNSNVILCKIYYYVSYLFSSLLPTVLILASIDRLLISSQNVDKRLYSSKRLAYFSISISTFFWIIFLFHILIEVNIQQFAPSVFVCYYDLSTFYLMFVTYSYVVIDVIVSFTMVILSMLTFKNVRRIRSVPRQQRNQVRSMNKKDFQLLRCLYAQDITYIIFSSVACAYDIYERATNDKILTPIEEAVDNFIGEFGTFLHHIPYCASFIIFISVSKAFRNELKRLAYKICGKNLMPIREEEHRQENIERENIELNVVDVVSTIALPA